MVHSNTGHLYRGYTFAPVAGPAGAARVFVTVGTAFGQRHDVIKLRGFIVGRSTQLPWSLHAAKVAAPAIALEYFPLVNHLVRATKLSRAPSVGASTPHFSRGRFLADRPAVIPALAAIGRDEFDAAPPTRARRIVPASFLPGPVVDLVPALIAAETLTGFGGGKLAAA